MALSIKDPETERLARELAKRTGESITEATRSALDERLRRLNKTRDPHLFDELERISRHCASLPVLDSRSADEILGYDEHGLPN